MTVAPRARVPGRHQPGTLSHNIDPHDDDQVTHEGTAVSVDQWADRIRPHLAQAVDGIVAAGRELTEAKAALPHGQFGPWLDGLGLSRQGGRRPDLVDHVVERVEIHRTGAR